MKYELPEWLKYLLGTAAVLTIIAILVGGWILYNNASTDSDQGTDIHNLVEQTNHSAIETCHRGNDSRAAQVKAYEQEIENLESDIENLRNDEEFVGLQASLVPPGPVQSALYGFAAEKKESIGRKHQTIANVESTINEIIAAQAPFAIKKGSPRIDCNEANALINLLTPLPSRISRRKT